MCSVTGAFAAHTDYLDLGTDVAGIAEDSVLWWEARHALFQTSF